jgi:serine/threonine protein kinase
MDVRGSPPYIEMEFAEGGRLSSHIRRSGPLLLHEAVTVGRHVASTLAYLHDRGILHLDVKPSNIVVAAPPRLIDFSIARRVDQVARISGHVGTDAYMAPEQADPGRWPSIGPKSDTWGLGVTLHQSLTGRRPYAKGRREARGAERFPQLTSAAEPPDVERYPSEVRALISDCLRPDPDLRPTVADVAERLDRLAGTARTA